MIIAGLLIAFNYHVTPRLKCILKLDTSTVLAYNKSTVVSNNTIYQRQTVYKELLIISVINLQQNSIREI